MAAIIIMSLQQKKRLRLITPTRPIKGKVLKSCVRCRQHKTKCDASITNPAPCTHCLKKNINCTLDIITTTPKRSYDVLEKLTHEVHDLRITLDRIIEKKSHMIRLLVQSGQQIQSQSQAQHPKRIEHSASNALTPSVSEIQSCLSSPTLSPAHNAINIDPIPTHTAHSHFTITSNKFTAPITITHSQALHYFQQYHSQFNKYLPILPESLFALDSNTNSTNLHELHNDNDLLFWSIIVTAHLTHDNPDQYRQLADHIKNLVVYKCWLNTPRSVYTLAALLILTTWPLPLENSLKIQDNICIKYISLMKSLSMQLGLHKLEFINEFSHKTNVDMANESQLNNLIRERIYKFVNINSNYWLVYLGLSNSNYNGFHQDYIINKAANGDLFNDDQFEPQDNYINSLLKISLIQSKLNENMNDLIDKPSNVAKLIDLNMFEIILNDFGRFSQAPGKKTLYDNNLIRLSVEFSKLQLYTYAFADVDLTINDYKQVVYKAINSCNLVLQLLHQEFAIGDEKSSSKSSFINYNQLPIHYRFIVEMVLLILMRIHSSPLLNRVGDYQYVKALFNQFYSIATTNNNTMWAMTLNSKLFKVLHKFDRLDNLKLITSKKENSFFLVNKMKNYLVSSLHYELIWLVYVSETSSNTSNTRECAKLIEDDDNINWEYYGLNKVRDGDVINYLRSSPSIFSS